MRQKFFITLLYTFFLAGSLFSQKPRLSLATDLDFLRSFKEDQRYWAIGQTINFHFHFTPKDGAYAWVCYYSYGKFANAVTATAKQPTTIPQDIDYINHAQLRFKEVSFGWRHYLRGAFDAEEGWNIYFYAGFGLMLGKVMNSQSVFIDTSQYSLPVLPGSAHFKRLTIDVGLGWEQPLGGDIFIFLEGRAWLPTTDYPSKYLFVNRNAPLDGSINIGLRLLFY